MLSKDSPKPLYVQLEEILRQTYINKEWEPNRAIPSELELSKIYGVSRMTVRSVITKLVNDGLLHRVQGKGTFISERKIATKSLAYMGIREQLEKKGYRITTKLIRFEKQQASGGVAEKLNLTSGDPIHLIERIRLIDNVPISIHRSYLPYAITQDLSEEKLETDQLCHILQIQFSLKAAFVHETLESTLARKDEAALLGVGESFPLLVLEDINKTQTGLIFEYTQVLFRGDRIKLNFEYNTLNPLGS